MDDTVDENRATFLEPYQRQKDDVEKKWWHINKKLLRFKLHFFFLGGGLSTVMPFVAVFARNTLQLSATSFGAVMIFQKFLFLLTKPSIGYVTDYFNKLRLVIFLLAVSQGLFLFLLFLIPPPSEELTGVNNSSVDDLACDLCYNINASVKIPVRFYQDVDSSKIRYIYLPQRCNLGSNDSAVHFENYGKIRIPKVGKTVKQNTSSMVRNYGNIRIPKVGQAVKQNTSSVNSSSDVFLTQSNTDYIYVLLTSNKTLACNSSSSSNTSSVINLNGCIICCETESDCYVISGLLGELKPVQTSKGAKEDFLTIQFWLFAVLFVGVNACINALYTLSDTALYEGVQKHGGEFGHQRLFSCVGWGLGAVVGGLLTDYTDNYNANFAAYAILSLVSLWNIYLLDFVKPNISNSILKDIGATMKSPEFICFEVGVLFMGFGLGFVWFYLIWYVTSIGGNRVVCGLMHTMQSFTGDVPFFFASGWVIRKIGYFNVLSLALFAYAVRFLWYSHLQDPWLILPMEWTHGITYGLFYATIASFAKKHAKPGTEATTQSVIFVTFDGLGGGIGNIVAGVGFDYFGGRNMFFYTGVFYCCCAAVSLFCTCVFRKRNQPAVNLQPT